MIDGFTIKVQDLGSQKKTNGFVAVSKNAINNTEFEGRHSRLGLAGFLTLSRPKTKVGVTAFAFNQ